MHSKHSKNFKERKGHENKNHNSTNGKCMYIYILLEKLSRRNLTAHHASVEWIFSGCRKVDKIL